MNAPGKERASRRNSRNRRRTTRLHCESLEDRLAPAVFTPHDVPALIAAIHASNATAEDDTIELDPGATYTLTAVDNTAHGPTGLPVIATGGYSLTINGHGATIQRSGVTGTPSFRIVDVSQGSRTSINDMTIAGGRVSAPSSGAGILTNAELSISGCTIRNNAVMGGQLLCGGGGIFNAGRLAVDSTTISDNAGGDSGSFRANGGGIYNGPGATSTISHSTILRNSAGGPGAGANGGAILNSGGTVSLVACTISQNISGWGGAIYNTNYAGDTSLSTMVIEDCIVSQNTGGNGVLLNGGSMTVRRCTIKENTAQSGGAFFNNGNPLSPVPNVLTVESTKISDNSATANGGAFFNSSTGGPQGSILVSNSSVERNSVIGSTSSNMGRGGAIYNEASVTVLNSSFLSNNTRDVNSGSGGAIASSGWLFVDGSSFRGNSARDGGAVAIYPGGSAMVSTSWFEQNSAFYGGSIRSNGGSVTVRSTTIRANTAYFTGGGIATSAASSGTFDACTVTDNVAGGFEGGGIANGIFTNDCTMLVSSSVIARNTADRGGGLSNWGAMTLESSTIADNSALSGSRSDGGGIFNSGNMSVTRGSSIRGNAALKGGGISNVGTLGIVASTIITNTATYGSGLDLGGKSTLKNTTVSSNSGGSFGGVMYRGSSLIVVNSTITANNGGGLVGGQIGLTGAILVNTVVAGNIGDNLRNLTLAAPSTNNFIGGDPRLGPLTDNGGPTPTHLPLPGSPLLQAGVVDAVLTAGLTTDQRGKPRVAGGAVDIGAVEVQPASVAGVDLNTGGAQRSRVAGPFVVTLSPGDAPAAAPDVSAFRLVRAGDGLSFPLVAEDLGLVDGVRQVRLSLGGPGLEAGSLPDGRYQLTAIANGVRDASYGLPMSADVTTSFHRFFGDVNGDAVVDATDYLAFRRAYLGGSVDGSNAYLDADGDGQFTLADLQAFNQRFVKRRLG